MTAVAIFLIVFALLFYIVTRTTYLYLRYDGEFRLQIHFVIFSLTLVNLGRDKGNGVSLGFYSSLIKNLGRLCRLSRIRIMRFSVASDRGNDFTGKFSLAYGISAAFSALFAYLEQNSKKITIEDNAVILTPDNNDTLIEVRLYTELYNVVISSAKLIFDLIKYSKKRKIRYVGN